MPSPTVTVDVDGRGNIQAPWGNDPQTPFDRTGDIVCPLMFHFGADDANPSLEDMRKYGHALTQASKEHVFHVQEGVGHAFMNFCNPERYREDAANISWSWTLDFFTQHLGGA